mgnify:CR=1 FL=1
MSLYKPIMILKGSPLSGTKSPVLSDYHPTTALSTHSQKPASIEPSPPNFGIRPQSYLKIIEDIESKKKESKLVKQRANSMVK